MAYVSVSIVWLDKSMDGCRDGWMNGWLVDLIDEWMVG